MSAAVSSRATRFPEKVWDVPVLRSLDARSRGELEAAGRMREVRAGDVVFRAGDAADVLYVVAEGAITICAVRRGDTEATVLRRVRAGEVFGEEAIVETFATRAFEARAEEKTRLAEIPVPVLLRAVGRGGDGEVVGRLERALRRAATFDLVRATSFGRRLSERELETLVDAVRHVHLARGEHLYREGDAPTEAFFVADGLLSAQTIDEGKPRVEAYLSRGDLFGEDELESREPRCRTRMARRTAARRLSREGTHERRRARGHAPPSRASRSPSSARSAYDRARLPGRVSPSRRALAPRHRSGLVHPLRPLRVELRERARRRHRAPRPAR
jgi:CRP-like cAMP-binding protein